MKDDYTWDRSGEPDPEVARLEDLLGELRHRPAPLDFSRMPAAHAVVRPFWTRGRAVLAMAACLLLVAAGLWVAGPRQAPGTRQGLWVASPVNGRPTLDASLLRRDARVAPGEWIETDRSSSVRLTADKVGMIDVRPGSRLRVLRSREGAHRLALAQGSLHALIWAPPGGFAVETASTTALDLGCSYTIDVDGRGAGRLQVVTGWVGLGSNGVEALVPQGAICRLHPGRGPGIPLFGDAPAALLDAVGRIDANPAAAGVSDARAAAGAARPRDAFTLWHLLRRLDGPPAAIVYERLAALAPPPPSVTRALVLAKDAAALEAWWDSLGLGSSSLFKTWRAAF